MNQTVFNTTIKGPMITETRRVQLFFTHWNDLDALQSRLLEFADKGKCPSAMLHHESDWKRCLDFKIHYQLWDPDNERHAIELLTRMVKPRLERGIRRGRISASAFGCWFQLKLD